MSGASSVEFFNLKFEQNKLIFEKIRNFNFITGIIIFNLLNLSRPGNINHLRLNEIFIIMKKLSYIAVDRQEITVTLFRDQRQEEYDNKDWFFILEDVKDGKRKPVAQGRLNLKDYARQIPHQENLKVRVG